MTGAELKRLRTRAGWTWAQTVGALRVHWRTLMGHREESHARADQARIEDGTARSGRIPVGRRVMGPGMTDTERIEQARWLLEEIAHALDCAVLGIDRAVKALRESGLVAAMLAAQAVIDVLGGSKETKR